MKTTRLGRAIAAATLSVAAGLTFGPLVQAAHATVPGHNGLIAFVRIVRTNPPVYPFATDIFTVRPDGTGQRRLTWNHHSSDPAWGPGGQRILFTRAGHIWLMQKTGAGKVRLPVAGSQPTWSPDAKRFAFIRDRQLYVYTFATRHAVQITNTGTIISDPDWSPTEGVIGFSSAKYPVDPSSEPTISQLWLVRPDGTELTDLSAFTNTSDAKALSWYPTRDHFHHQRMVYSYGNPGDPAHYPKFTEYFRTQDLRNRNVHDIASHEGTNPTWSPDGQWIAAARGGLWLMRAPDGLEAHCIVVTHNYLDVLDVDWQPRP